LAAFSWESRERRAILARHQILDVIKLADTPERRLVRHMLSMRDQDSTEKALRIMRESADEGFGTSAPIGAGGAEVQVARGVSTVRTMQKAPDAHALRVAKLLAHIKAVKKSGAPEGFASKTAFLKSLQNGRAKIDRQSLYQWETGKPMNAPGHAVIIEAAIDRLPA
jgi:hypothetical protein